MRTHLEYARPAARDNEFVDAPEAIGLHMLLAEALESWDDLDDEQGWYPAEAVATELRAAFVAATAERRTDSGARHRGPEAPRQPPTPCASTMTANGLEELRAAIEPHRRPAHGRYAGIADWMNKLPDTIVRTAAAITLLHDPDAQEITGATVRDAVRVGRAGISHARAAFGLTRPDGEAFSQARQVLATVHRMCLDAGTDSLSRRDLHQKLRDRPWVETVESLDVPIELLRAGARGRPASSRAGRWWAMSAPSRGAVDRPTSDFLHVSVGHPRKRGDLR